MNVIEYGMNDVVDGVNNAVYNVSDVVMIECGEFVRFQINQ